MSEGTQGPRRSKNDIDLFENWLETHCKEKMLVNEIQERYQYLTGHEPRKILQYLKAIETYTQRIKLFNNDGKQFCIWTGGQHAAPLEKNARPKPSDIIDGLIIRQKMQEGPCAHGCLFPNNTDCRQCARFRSLKNRDFLEE